MRSVARAGVIKQPSLDNQLWQPIMRAHRSLRIRHRRPSHELNPHSGHIGLATFRQAKTRWRRRLSQDAQTGAHARLQTKRVGRAIEVDAVLAAGRPEVGECMRATPGGARRSGGCCAPGALPRPRARGLGWESVQPNRQTFLKLLAPQPLAHISLYYHLPTPALSPPRAGFYGRRTCLAQPVSRGSVGLGKLDRPSAPSQGTASVLAGKLTRIRPLVCAV